MGTDIENYQPISDYYIKIQELPGNKRSEVTFKHPEDYISTEICLTSPISNY